MGLSLSAIAQPKTPQPPKKDDPKNLGYVSPEEEVSILSAQEKGHPLDLLASCVSLADVVKVKRAVQEVRMSDELKRYIVDITGATRSVAGVQLGASPRASLALMKVAQAAALLDGQPFVSPEQIQEMAVPVIAHRLILDPQARFSGLTAAAVVGDVIKRIPVPS